MKRLVMMVLAVFFGMSTMLFASGDLTVGGSLEMTSTNKGFLPPRMTTTQRDSISSPTVGMLIYNTSEDAFNYYAGSSWVTFLASESLRDASRGLRISCASASSLTVSAAEVILQDTTGLAKSFVVSNATGAPTFVGAGGRDAGTEQASVWYFIWLVGKSDGTVSVLLSLSSTSPTLPSGYTYEALVGAVYNDSGSNFVQFEQVGNQVILNTLPRQILSGGLTTSTWTSVSSTTLSPFFPATAKKWYFLAGSNGNHMVFAPFTSGWGGHYFRPGVGSLYQATAGNPGGLALTDRIYWTDFKIPNITGNLYYYVVNANSDLYAVGWEY